jgi:hypothetical protein
MDASDIIKGLRDKTIYCNLLPQIIAARPGATPQTPSPLNVSTIYNFPSFEIRQSFFEGRAEVASTSSTFCFQ